MRFCPVSTFGSFAFALALGACGASGSSDPDLNGGAGGSGGGSPQDASTADAQSARDGSMPFGDDAGTTGDDATTSDDESDAQSDAATTHDANGFADSSGQDAETMTDAGADASMITSSDASVDASKSDAASTADSGDAGASAITRLHTGSDTLYGLTADGYAIVVDATDGNLKAISTNDSTAAPVILSSAAVGLIVQGNYAMFWESLNQATNVGTIKVWSSAGGVTPALSTKSVANVGAISANGDQVLYTSSSTDGVSASLIGADGTNFGTAHTLIAAGGFGIGDGTTSCIAQIGFAGSFAVAAYCAPAGAIASAKGFNTASTWAASTLATNIYPYWSADTAGIHVAFVSHTDAATRVTLASNSSVTLASSNINLPFLSGDGTTAFLQTDNDAFERSSLSGALNFQNVVSTGFAVFRAVSSDWSHAIYSVKANLDSNDEIEIDGDLRLVSISAAAQTYTSLVATEPPSLTGGIFGSAFTVDNTYVLYFSQVDPTSLVGTFTTQTLAGGSQRTFANAWADIATSGTKVVFSDNHVAATTNVPAREDIHAVDVATVNDATSLASSVDSTWIVNQAGSKIVYTDSNGSTTQGLYVQVLP